jgi:hypothetical protein
VERAKRELLKAISISPRRPDARVLLSSVLVSLHDTAGAMAQLDSAMALSSDFYAPFIYAAKLQIASGNVDSSAALLTRALRGSELPVEGLVRSVLDSLRQRRDDERAATISRLYIHSSFGAESTRTRALARLGSNPLANDVVEALPILYLRLGDNVRAVRAARDLVFFEPNARDAAAKFIADVQSGRGALWLSSERITSSSSLPAPRAAPK